MVIVHCSAAYDYNLAVDKFDFAPVQSPDMRSSQRRNILVQGDEPQKLSVKFCFWAEWAILEVKNTKIKTKIGLLLTLFFTCQTILQT